MLYNILKIPARIALVIYCRDLKINDRRALAAKGPLLIAANHPNSFLDAIIIATLFDQPVYSLARGDAFTNRFTISLLKSLNILPVYRLSEGAENLGHNYSTFEQCRDIFKNGIVLIFSEGRCINEWKLRPLMKGTARARHQQLGGRHQPDHPARRDQLPFIYPVRKTHSSSFRKTFHQRRYRNG